MIKNVKIILLVLIGVLLMFSFGCGGGGGGIDDEGNAEPQEEIQEEQTDEAVSKLLDKILTPDSDGSPMIFDYAPKPASTDENAVSDPQKLHFVKYISSRDLNSDGEYVKTIHLNKDSEYVIKYSHGGRLLTNSLLGVRITAPDKNEMEFKSLKIEGDDGIIIAQEYKNVCEEIREYIKDKVKDSQVFTPCYVD